MRHSPSKNECQQLYKDCLRSIELMARVRQNYMESGNDRYGWQFLGSFPGSILGNIIRMMTMTSMTTLKTMTMTGKMTTDKYGAIPMVTLEELVESQPRRGA